MKKFVLYLITAAFMVACSNVMITGRKQLLLVNDAELLTMSLKSYQEFIDSVPASKDVKNIALVRSVGVKISKAVEEYMKANGLEHNSECFLYARWESGVFRRYPANDQNRIRNSGGDGS